MEVMLQSISNETKGVFVSVPQRKAPWALQAWLVLVGVPTSDQSAHDIYCHAWR